MPVQQNLPGGTYLLIDLQHQLLQRPVHYVALLLPEDNNLQPGDQEMFSKQCSLQSREMLVVMVMDGLATDYLMTSYGTLTSSDGTGERESGS